MELKIKRFGELSNSELYAIMKLRVDVFVVEQRCAYAELDGRDQAALHVFLRTAGKWRRIFACFRAGRISRTPRP